MSYPFKDSQDQLGWDLAEFEMDYRYWRYEKDEDEKRKLPPLEPRVAQAMRSLFGIAEALRMTMIEQTDRIVEALEKRRR